MKTTEFTYLLQNPTQLNKEQTSELEQLIIAFPYFQSARSLLLKGLKDQESFRYNQELKTTAAYTTDRSVLFDFITSPIFNQNLSLDKEEKKNKSDIKVIEPKEIIPAEGITTEHNEQVQEDDAKKTLDPSFFERIKENDTQEQQITTSYKEDALPEKNNIKEEKGDKNNVLEKDIHPDTPLDFNTKETHSFAEWLKLTSLHPINRKDDQKTKVNSSENEEKKAPKTLETKDKFELIDEFISNNPKIKPVSKSASIRNLAEKNLIPTDQLMTETLAKVYLAQKNYKKAIQAYNILILKNPEKSGFFADQIRAIKKLKENK
ncbi:hypothetical protein [Aquimarina pacifica]|uniref:hypothetical protein n=1 Tax=Aquimarina pacifica TaxID=1296415 RepID=UPI000471B086|nr:hypothetical protein [Aquimarina pacifica]